jgi:hypothetical protein
MSNIGVFAIIINDGKQDAMLQATDFLRNRLVMIRMERQKNPKIKDATPTLRDVEETHILFINAHFRPFVTFAYEYHKTSLNGTVNFGSSGVTFSIEQYGEFFHDMVVNVQVTATDTGSTGMYVAWAENLGNKLFELVRFRVNGTELDAYTHESANFFNKFMITPNKRYGYNTLIGQENPLLVRVGNSGFTGAAGTTGALTDQYNRLDTIVHGLQTAKPQHPAFELWIPIQFWFNNDVRVSFPSIAVPYGQRFIEINLAALETLLFAVGSSTTSVSTAVTADQINSRVFASVGSQTSSWNSVPTISNMSIYTNNIFVHKDIHEIYLKRVGFNMVRVHREQVFTVTAANETHQLQQLKWPIETVYMGMRPKTNANHPDLWDRYHAVLLTDQVSMLGLANTAAPNGPAYTANVQLLEQTPTIDSLTLTLHNVPIYQNQRRSFFSAYIPHNYGAQHINTPDDRGAMMITFNLFPGGYQPSGYINISRAREFYAEYFSSVIGVTPNNQLLCGAGSVPTTPTQGNWYILGIAINFLLVSDGSAVLRYTT